MMIVACAACYNRFRTAEHGVQHDPEMKKRANRFRYGTAENQRNSIDSGCPGQ